MKKRLIWPYIVGLALLIIVGIYYLTRQTSIYDTDIKNQTKYFNTLEMTTFYFSEDTFDQTNQSIRRKERFSFDRTIPFRAGLNVYIIDLEERQLTQEDFKKLYDLLNSNVKASIYLVGGTDFSFLKPYFSLGTDKEGNEVYTNTEKYMHHFYNHSGVIEMSSTDYSNREKEQIFGDTYYLSYLVFFNIEKDLRSYYRFVGA